MEIQPQWEEFIIAIFKMNRRQGKATNKELSQWLFVSPSLVTELIKKMQTEGILAPGKNIIALTDAGEAAAKRIISKHRLWEYFLTETLNFNWKDVHAQASALQSVTSDELFEKLNDFLRRPARMSARRRDLRQPGRGTCRARTALREYARHHLYHAAHPGQYGAPRIRRTHWSRAGSNVHCQGL